MNLRIARMGTEYRKRVIRSVNLEGISNDYKLLFLAKNSQNHVCDCRLFYQTNSREEAI